MKNIHMVVLSLLVIVCLIPEETSGKSTLMVTLDTGHTYHKVQLITLTADSLIFWAAGDTIVVPRTRLYSMQIQRPNRGLLGMVIGGVLGSVVGVSEGRTASGLGSAFVAPVYPAWYGIVGGLVGGVIGLVASRDYTYHFHRMDPDAAQAALDWLMEKYQLHSRGT